MQTSHAVDLLKSGRAISLGQAFHGRDGRGVTAEECRHIEIVHGDFACDFANIFLYLMDDVDLLRLEPLR